MKISVFDLDHTLINCNIAFEFGKYLYQQGRVSFSKALFLALSYLAYKVGATSHQTLHRLYFRHLLDPISKEELDHFADDFIETQLFTKMNSSVFQQLHHSASEGHYILLLSNSPFFLVERVGAIIGANESIGTTYSNNGTIATLDGMRKAEIVKGKALEWGISLDRFTAYSDSILDLPLLQSVGNPVVVSPDYRLKVYSLFYKWKQL